MPKKPVPVATNNYMISWYENGTPHWLEIIGRDNALYYFKKIREKHPETARMYRMVIDNGEGI